MPRHPGWRFRLVHRLPREHRRGHVAMADRSARHRRRRGLSGVRAFGGALGGDAPVGGRVVLQPGGAGAVE